MKEEEEEEKEEKEEGRQRKVTKFELSCNSEITIPIKVY